MTAHALAVELYLVIGGAQWRVERRHEMVQLARRGAERERQLFLFFHGPDGELRRTEIAADFPEDPPAPLLEAAWHGGEVLRGADPGEMTSHGALTVPRLRDVLRLTARAVRLRCPNCGGGPVLLSWFRLRGRCPTCGIRLERGEEQDYYLGGMFFNIMLAETLFAVVFLAGVVVMWPAVPWDGIEYVLAAAMIGAPILLYPMSRVLWLAFDLLIRPVTPEEMAWHARTRDETGAGEDRAG